MKTYTVELHIETAPGKAHKHGRPLRVMADDVDAAKAAARKLVKEQGLPPIRAMSIATPGNRIVVYLLAPPMES